MCWCFVPSWRPSSLAGKEERQTSISNAARRRPSSCAGQCIGWYSGDLSSVTETVSANFYYLFFGLQVEEAGDEDDEAQIAMQIQALHLTACSDPLLFLSLDFLYALFRRMKKSLCQRCLFLFSAWSMNKIINCLYICNTLSVGKLSPSCCRHAIDLLTASPDAPWHSAGVQGLDRWAAEASAWTICIAVRQ